MPAEKQTRFKPDQTPHARGSVHSTLDHPQSTIVLAHRWFAQGAAGGMGHARVAMRSAGVVRG